VFTAASLFVQTQGPYRMN